MLCKSLIPKLNSDLAWAEKQVGSKRATPADRDRMGKFKTKLLAALAVEPQNGGRSLRPWFDRHNFAPGMRNLRTVGFTQAGFAKLRKLVVLAISVLELWPDSPVYTFSDSGSRCSPARLKHLEKARQAKRQKARSVENPSRESGPSIEPILTPINVGPNRPEIETFADWADTDISPDGGPRPRPQLSEASLRKYCERFFRPSSQQRPTENEISGELRAHLETKFGLKPRAGRPPTQRSCPTREEGLAARHAAKQAAIRDQQRQLKGEQHDG